MNEEKVKCQEPEASCQWQKVLTNRESMNYEWRKSKMPGARSQLPEAKSTDKSGKYELWIMNYEKKISNSCHAVCEAKTPTIVMPQASPFLKTTIEISMN